MFKSLLGNENIKSVLRRMLQNRRIPGAMIFAGDEGVGKRQFAFGLAKAFLCRNPKDNDFCGLCAACLRVDTIELPKSNDKDDNEKVFFTQHPDVAYIRPAGKFVTVDTIRQLQHEANLRPFEGTDERSGARFFLIDSADRMNDAAANSLLKTLEEPAATSHLILITSRPDSLLPTIRSRCQIFRFAPVPNAEIESFLLESKKVSPNDAKLLSRIARGSLGRALSTNLDLYKTQRDTMMSAVEALTISNDKARLLKIAEELNDAKVKDEYETRLTILTDLIHDVWSIHLGLTAEIINHDLQIKLAKYSEKADSRRIQSWLTEIEILRENLAVNLNRKIATDALFIKMANA